MSNNISSALGAYQQALSRIGAKNPVASEEVKAQEASFKDVVKEVVTNTVDLSKKGEQLSMQGIAGKADIQDVVLAVSNAETALETVVAVRDTAIKAYKEIMQMAM